VFNKIDLSGDRPRAEEGPHGWRIHVSAKTGEGLDALRRALLKLAGGGGWMPIYGAALLSLLVPVLLVLALRSEAPHDREELWKFVADQVEGRPG